MREIKFRAWDREAKNMWYPTMIDTMYYESIGKYALFSNPNQTDDKRFSSYYGENGNHDLMQFTGLRDKNGVEIYEGDFIRDSWNGDLHVFWESGSFVIKTPDDDYMDLWEIVEMGCEVIGNIYENPELL